MDENITYDYLWQAYQKEKQTNQLLLIPKTFYEDIFKFVNNVQTNTNFNQTTKDNTIMLVNDFFEKRKQKILIYIAYNKQLPQPISNNELEFYNKLLQIVKEEKLDFAVQTKTNTNSLKSTKDIPEIILPSGNKIGPLAKNQIIEIENQQDKSYLLENTICEIY
ncbi:MAG: hypothetical protein ABR981_00370 [Candidatus Micrarchaeaceae archaeon]|jgi:DNA replication initiation complex subunit (GINS family)